MRVTRRSLKTLQHTASDRENLVGRPSKSLKHQLSQEPSVYVNHLLSAILFYSIWLVFAYMDLFFCFFCRDIEVKRKNLSTKETQANLDTKVSVDDLTNPEGASEKYWKILAEKRQCVIIFIYLFYQCCKTSCALMFIIFFQTSLARSIR